MTEFPRVQLRHLSVIPIVNGLGLPGSNNNPEWPRYIRTTDIASPTRLRDDVFASQPPEVASSALVSQGDILMTAAGSIGKSVRFLESYPACFAGFLVRLRPRTSDSGRYLGYWMQSQDYLDQISVGAVKSTIENFSASRYRALSVPLPPHDEQRAIADYLDQETSQIDALVAKQEQFIDLLRERRHAAIEHVISIIEADRAALRHFGDLVAGSGFPVGLQGQADMELPFFKVANLKGANRDGVLVRSEHTISRSAAKALRATVIPKGSLVFAKVGAALLLGRVGALPDDGCIDNNMAALILDESIDLKFARYLMLTFDFRKFVLPGPVPSLDMDGLREFRVPVLSLDRQRAIADSLDEQTSRIDALIAKADEHIVLAKERRAALITAAVTGQFDVRTARKAG